MTGKIFITSTGYDPQYGKAVSDPYLGDPPTLGACRPDIREKLQIGDHIFVISGKVQGHSQFVMATFQVDEKIHASEAVRRFPEMRLKRNVDGEITGNIIVDADGNQHDLDHHRKETFENRVSNFIVGKNLIAPTSQTSVDRARAETIEVLQDTLDKRAARPIDIVKRYGVHLDEKQVFQLRSWLERVCRGRVVG